ncbi:hypothetical protein MATL_G00036390 [Megalops atlanticus]|uniref:Thrombospondin-like N-terminal domain-containing protein n=1 Tax=Megalops atlanticus TaxID=7932 RepID=A0A9D3QEU8_MEGAT|nr:hypothetical protein MATL_G00036390 [Megalops atlanticus]
MNSRLLLWSLGIHLVLWYCHLSAEAQVLEERGSKGHLDLTELIGVPLPPSVSFITGYEGFPAFSFGPDANIGRLTKTFVPDPFFRDFAVIVTIKPTTSRGGVLFAITDAFQKIVYLGLALTPVEDQTQRIILYYSEQGSSRSQQVASFKVPDMSNKWNRFTLTVQDDEVRLYMDCEEYHRVAFQRSSGQLTFEASSGIFVGNAGGTGLERFVGSIQQLVLKPDPRAAEEQCEEDDPYASGDGSGDDGLDDRETVDEVKKRVDEREFTSPWPEDSLSTPVQAPPTQAPYDDDADDYSGDLPPTEEPSSSQGIELTAERGEQNGPVQAVQRTGTEETDQEARSQDRKENKGSKAPPGLPDPLGPLAQPCPPEGAQREDSLVPEGPRGLQGPPECQEHQGKMASLGVGVKMAIRENRDRRDFLDWQENREPREKRVILEWATLGLQDPPDPPAHPAQPGSRMAWMCMAQGSGTSTVTLRSSEGPLVLPVPLESLALQVPAFPLGPQRVCSQGHPVPLVPRGKMGRMERWVNLACLAPLVLMEVLDYQEKEERRVTWE